MSFLTCASVVRTRLGPPKPSIINHLRALRALVADAQV
jgi:hypothetical protein